MTENINRRDALNLLASTGTLAAFGSTAASGSSNSAFFTEIGVEYSLPKENNYDVYHVDGLKEYRINGSV